MDGQRIDGEWLQCLSRYEHGGAVRVEADAITHTVDPIYRHRIAIRPDLLLRGHGRRFEWRGKRVLKPGDSFNSIEVQHSRREQVKTNDLQCPLRTEKRLTRRTVTPTCPMSVPLTSSYR